MDNEMPVVEFNIPTSQKFVAGGVAFAIAFFAEHLAKKGVNAAFKAWRNH